MQILIRARRVVLTAAHLQLLGRGWLAALLDPPLLIPFRLRLARVVCAGNRLHTNRVESHRKHMSEVSWKASSKMVAVHGANQVDEWLVGWSVGGCASKLHAMQNSKIK